MFRDASIRKFDVLLFWALDRLSREGVLETLQHLNRLTSYGVGYRSFTEQYFDSCGIFKDAVIAIIATVAKQERIRISQRVKAGLETARAKGKRIGRPPPTLLSAETRTAIADSYYIWAEVPVCGYWPRNLALRWQRFKDALGRILSDHFKSGQRPAASRRLAMRLAR